MILSDEFEENQGKLLSNLKLIQFLSDHVLDLSSCEDLKHLTEDESDMPKKEIRTYLNLTDKKLGLFAYGKSCFIIGYGCWTGFQRKDRLGIFEFDSDKGKLIPIFVCFTSPKTEQDKKKCSMLVRTLLKQLVPFINRKDAKTYLSERLNKLLKGDNRDVSKIR